MNELEFKKVITHEHKTDNTANYVLSIAFICMGIYFLYKIYADYDSTKGNAVFLILLLPFILFSTGFYGLWRISKDYIVTSISSTKTISEKENLIDKYFSISKHKIVWKEKRDDLIYIRYRNVFWNFVDLKIYIDDNKYIFNAQGADLTRSKGIIDFGLTKRANNKLKKYFQNNG
jgi:hypothetical protein